MFDVAEFYFQRFFYDLSLQCQYFFVKRICLRAPSLAVAWHCCKLQRGASQQHLAEGDFLGSSGVILVAAVLIRTGAVTVASPKEAARYLEAGRGNLPARVTQGHWGCGATCGLNVTIYVYSTEIENK